MWQMNVYTWHVPLRILADCIVWELLQEVRFEWRRRLPDAKEELEVLIQNGEDETINELYETINSANDRYI